MSSSILGLGVDGTDENESYGVNRFKEKKEKADLDAEYAITVDDFSDGFLKFLTKDLPSTAVSAYQEIKKGLTPPFIVRLNNRKIHAQIIQDAEKYEIY